MSNLNLTSVMHDLISIEGVILGIATAWEARRVCTRADYDRIVSVTLVLNGVRAVIVAHADDVKIRAHITWENVDGIYMPREFHPSFMYAVGDGDKDVYDEFGSYRKTIRGNHFRPVSKPRTLEEFCVYLSAGLRMAANGLAFTNS